MRVPSRSHVGTALCAAVMLLAFAVIVGVRDARAAPVPPLEPAPLNYQKCMDDNFANQQRCKSIWCNKFFWFFTNCNDEALLQCLENVQATFDACISEGPSA